MVWGGQEQHQDGVRIARKVFWLSQVTQGVSEGINNFLLSGRRMGCGPFVDCSLRPRTEDHRSGHSSHECVPKSLTITIAYYRVVRNCNYSLYGKLAGC